MMTLKVHVKKKIRSAISLDWSISVILYLVIWDLNISNEIYENVGDITLTHIQHLPLVSTLKVLELIWGP